MAVPTHSKLTGDELHVPGYIQASDPGAVGAGKLWVDITDSDHPKPYIRNSDNSSWVSILNGSGVQSGGTIDNTVIGGTAPAAGTFTSLTADTTTLVVNRTTHRVSIGVASSLGSKLQVTADAANAISSNSYPQLTLSGATNTNKQLRAGYDTTANVGFLQAETAGTGYDGIQINPNGGNILLGASGATVTLPANLTASSDMSISRGAADAHLYINTNSGQLREVHFQSAGASRWAAGVTSTTESGGSVGTDFRITKYLDVGTANDVLIIARATGKADFKFDVQIEGALDHDGSTLGFYGVTPVSRPSAYTQTYATASRTHSNPTATALTAASGTADNTVADVGTSFSQSTLNNNFKDIATQINNLITDLANVKQVLNSVIDDDQAQGLKQ